MAVRSRNLRLLTRVVVVFGAVLGFRAAAGCNSADYTDPGPCTGPSCTCEQDPTMPRCKGFNDHPETGADLPDGAFQFDAGEARGARRRRRGRQTPATKGADSAVRATAPHRDQWSSESKPFHDVVRRLEASVGSCRAHARGGVVVARAEELAAPAVEERHAARDHARGSEMDERRARVRNPCLERRASLRGGSARSAA